LISELITQSLVISFHVLEIRNIISNRTGKRSRKRLFVRCNDLVPSCVHFIINRVELWMIFMPFNGTTDTFRPLYFASKIWHKALDLGIIEDDAVGFIA